MNSYIISCTPSGIKSSPFRIRNRTFFIFLLYSVCISSSMSLIPDTKSTKKSPRVTAQAVSPGNFSYPIKNGITYATSTITTAHATTMLQILNSLSIFFFSSGLGISSSMTPDRSSCASFLYLLLQTA